MGTSEEYLNKVGWKQRGLLIETKIYPTIVSSDYSVGSLPDLARTNSSWSQAFPGIPKEYAISHSPEVCVVLPRGFRRSL